MNDSNVGERRRQPSGALLARDLVVLQLLAHGYSLAQIDYLIGQAGDARHALGRAAAALDIQTPEDAPAEARRRGLII